MKHQYSTVGFWKKSLQLLTDCFVDIYLKFSFNSKTYPVQFQKPKNILLITLGHLGDTLILSYIFPIIRLYYPESNIDVLTGQWCKPILKNNPYIRNVIVFNHFRQNRIDKNLWKRWLEHRNSSNTAIKNINLTKYDLSIEGRISHPNGNLISYRGKIKRRIGFGSGGFGSLLTDEILFPNSNNFHLLEAVLLELKKIKIERSLNSITPYYILGKEIKENKHPLIDYFKEIFIILHTETGKNNKLNRSISKEYWLEIIRIILKNPDIRVIVCGTSMKSTELFNFLSLNIERADKNLIDAVGKLSLDEFFILSKYAKAAITIDSLAAHMCAINCNTVSFYKNCIGTLFFPLSNKKAFVIHNYFSPSEIKTHSNTISCYAKEIESKATLKIFEDIFISLNI